MRTGETLHDGDPVAINSDGLLIKAPDNVTPCGNIIFRAPRDIKQGEALTLRYGPLDRMPTATEQESEQ